MRRQRQKRPNHTLQTTALVNEAYLRLVKQRKRNWENRAQFFGIAAQLMRRILADHARARRQAKRGGSYVRVSLPDATAIAKDRDLDVILVDEALNRLAEIDPRQAKIVEMRFFGGLTVEEIATALGISPRTVKREWTEARHWLYREIRGEE